MTDRKIKKSTRSLALLLIMSFTYIISTIFMGLSASADTTVTMSQFIEYHCGTDGNVNSIPTYQVLAAGSCVFTGMGYSSDEVTAYEADDKLIASAFGGSSAYTSWRTKVLKYVTLKDGSVSATSSDTDSTNYNDVQGTFSQYIASYSVGKMTGDQFDSNKFNPTNGAMQSFMQIFYYWIGIGFSVVTKALFYWFLLQTGFDGAYLTIPLSRDILSGGQGGSGEWGGGSTGGGKGNKWWQKKLVSDEVIAAVGSSKSGASQFSDSATGSKNVFLAYFAKIFPKFLFVTTYLVLVAAGWYPVIISAFSGFVSKILSGAISAW